MEGTGDRIKSMTPDQLQAETRPTKRSIEAPVIGYFREVKAYIENQGLEQERRVKIIETKEGGKIRVIYTAIDLTKFRPVSKETDQPLIASVYAPGLFESSPANTGNNELRLASGLFSKEDEASPNFIMFIHAEGLNSEAYLHGQKEVGAAGAQVAQELINEFKIKHGLPEEKGVAIDGLGYSEGSNKILSIMAKLSEKFTVRRVTSIGGAGLMGSQNLKDINPVKDVLDALKRAGDIAKEKRLSGRIDGEIPGQMPNVRISTEPITKMSRRLTGPEQINPLDDVKNIAGFAKRFFDTWIGSSRPDTVPPERIQAALAYNSAIETLLKKDIPVLTFANESDPFFPADRVKNAVEGLRFKAKLKGNRPPKIMYVTGDFGHAGPHEEQTSFNWLVQTMESAWKKHLQWQKDHLGKPHPTNRSPV